MRQLCANRAGACPRFFVWRTNGAAAGKTSLSWCYPRVRAPDGGPNPMLRAAAGGRYRFLAVGRRESCPGVALRGGDSLGDAHAPHARPARHLNRRVLLAALPLALVGVLALGFSPEERVPSASAGPALALPIAQVSLTRQTIQTGLALLDSLPTGMRLLDQLVQLRSAKFGASYELEVELGEKHSSSGPLSRKTPRPRRMWTPA